MLRHSDFAERVFTNALSAGKSGETVFAVVVNSLCLAVREAWGEGRDPFPLCCGQGFVYVLSTWARGQLRSAQPNELC